MITIGSLLLQVPGLPEQDVDRWISLDWVRPEERAGEYIFRDIDVARVRLIQELRDELDINESALPVVLLLLDQLYDLRRRMSER